jgi:hypothetical protein
MLAKQLCPHCPILVFAMSEFLEYMVSISFDMHDWTTQVLRFCPKYHPLARKLFDVVAISVANSVPCCLCNVI